MYKNENNQKSLQIENIAEQWVNLLFAQLEYKKRNKKENKDGKTR